MPAARGADVIRATMILLMAAPAFLYNTAPDASPPLLAAAAAVQLLAVTALFTGNWAPRSRLAAIAGILAIIALILNLPGLSMRSAALALIGVCHAAIYCGLLIWFTSSLKPGREPIVTALARRVRRTTPDKVVRYTRKVTIAWCLFFVTQLALSAALLLLAPANVWSSFLSLLNVPLLLAMLIGEFSIRLIIFRHEPRTSLADTLSAMRHARILSTDRS